MDTLLSFVKALSMTRYEHDFADRLSFQVTSLIFALATALTSYKSYFANPILCWTPMQFKDGWIDYTNDYCFIENTYYVPMAEQNLPTNLNKREEAKLSYYQWVPFVLALQATTFCLPYLFWRTFNWISGIQVRAIINMAISAGNTSSPKINHDELSLVCNHMMSGLEMSRRDDFHHGSSHFFALFLRVLKTRRYVSICYLLAKIFYIVNIFAQIVIINFFLDIRRDDLMWGMRLLFRLSHGSDWSDTGIFPRVTMCDFEIRELGNLHRWTVQCVLPLNMFNEKIFVFLWFWLHILLIVFIVNWLFWSCNIITYNNRFVFIDKCVKTAKVLNANNDRMVDSSYDKPLNSLVEKLDWDGVLLLRLISSNAGELTSACLAHHIYKRVSEGK